MEVSKFIPIKQFNLLRGDDRLTMEKNSRLELLRIVFTLIICLYHGHSFTGGRIWLINGYMCVEFFFILSGYFLYKSFQREKKHSIFTYLRHRLSRLYPEYLFAAVVAIIFLGVVRGEFDINKAINEILIMQNTGLFHLGGYNYPCWYVSILLLASCFLYSAITLWKEKVIKFILPLTILLIYTFLGGLESGFENWSYIGPFSIPLLRGAAGMSVGILIADAPWRTDVKENCRSWLLPLIEACGIVIVSTGLTSNIWSEMFIVFGFALIIGAIDLSDNSNYNSKVDGMIFKAGEYCYSVYLNHAIVLSGLKYIDKYFLHLSKGRYLIYIICVVVYSIITHFIVFKTVRIKQRK